VGFALASTGLLITAPVILITAIAIKLDSRGPVFFKQERIGENGRIFKVYKFRSMRTDAELNSGPVWAQEDDPRITRVGRIIRNLRIDEIPQMWNVLKGDMSFVGPRPERPHFVNELRKSVPYYDQRHTVKPGITGWAQVLYPYGASEDDALQKLKYDLYYVKHMSVVMDLLIVVKTIKIVLFGRGSR
jgi:exopolysaccharide biosynthesis polyprenyl glycosylphosphotransferase